MRFYQEDKIGYIKKDKATFQLGRKSLLSTKPFQIEVFASILAGLIYGEGHRKAQWLMGWTPSGKGHCWPGVRKLH